MYDAIFVGSGTNELVAAAYLAKAKKRVLVLEPGAVVGGTSALTEIAPGFRVETCGASSGWLSPKIVRDLDLADHGLDVEVPEQTACTITPDGALLLSQDIARSREAIARYGAIDAGKWEAFATRMARLAGFLEALYTNEAPRIMSSAAGDMVHLMGLGLRLRRLGKIDMVELIRTLPMSIQDLLDDWFESDLLKATLAAGALANLFQGPRSQGTCFQMLHHLVGRPPGAFRARTVAKSERGHLASVLAGAAKRLGVTIETSAIDKITTAGGRATGVALASGKVIEGRTIVSGLDPRRTFFDLLDPSELDPETVRAVGNVKLRGVRAFVDLALGELPVFTHAPPGEEHLRAVISLSPNLDYLERAFDDAKHRRVSSSLHLEATLPSLFDPSLAPEGKHVMSVAVQFVPYRLRAGKWDAAAKEALADRVVATLTEAAPNLAGAVIARRVTTPADLESTYGLTEGHLYQGELTLDQILFMRPIPEYAHYQSPIESLFLCGDATHPGGALPGLAGANAAREILKRR